jgi:hypothetical protein
MTNWRARPGRPARATFREDDPMLMKAPPGTDGINVGGGYFPVAEDGTITVPDTYSPEGIAALHAAFFTSVVETETPAQAAVFEAIDASDAELAEHASPTPEAEA